ncbi:cytochrome P450 [Podospora fimiseda]|uniref:Cytochrome P450 n=1 Tax=Podospora fimiseda TaxID=252190 RepID=A0AAN7BL43_9PEZI|nr:cytochrome P450 [Podospora fimiseda]
MTSNLTFWSNSTISLGGHRVVTIPTAPSPAPIFRFLTSFTLTSFVLAVVALVLLGTYAKTWHAFFIEGKEIGEKGIPRVYPYSLPWIQSALSFGLYPAHFVSATTDAVGKTTAFGLKTLGTTLYFLTGRDNLAQIRKHQGQITDPGIQSFCLIRVFGMSQKAVEVIENDDSGILMQPASDSTVAPHNRIDYNTHAGFIKMLSGDGLNLLFQRWHGSFSRRLLGLDIRNDWASGSDLEGFFMSPLVSSLNEAMAGPILEHVNPQFTENFIEFMPYVHSLFRGLPRWLNRRACALRDSLTQDTKKWHAIARDLTRDSKAQGDEGVARYWGVPAMMERQKILHSLDKWDDDSVASSDFGLLWGANINVHTASLWCIIEIFRDPVLLGRIRAELNTITITADEDLYAWIEQLMALPLLQSVYAEVLRLRVEVQTVFRDKRQDLQINKWRFPKNSLVMVPTKPAHMDQDYWNTQNGKYPVDTFWADRFVEYPNDPNSGPMRNSRNAGKDKEPKFIVAGTSDSWIPYGVGDRACPGRFFAKREICAFVAMIVQNYELELPSVSGGDAMKRRIPSNYLFYGLGVMRPRDKFPFRIRRIQREEKSVLESR